MNDHFDQLVNYIKQHLDQGVPEDHIRQALHQHNWDHTLVEQGFAAAKTPAQPAGTQHAGGPVATQKYTVTQALQELFKAIANNATAYALAALVSIAASVAVLYVINYLIGLAFYAPMGWYFLPKWQIWTMLVVYLVAYTAWYAFAGAFITSAVALALADGRHGHKSSLNTILKQALARTRHVAGAHALFVMVSIWPAVLVIALPLILLLTSLNLGLAVFLFVPLTYLAAMVWVVVTVVRFALAPYVALFEPEVRVAKTLGRSKQLLMRGGQLFLVKGLLLVFLISFAISAATHTPYDKLANNTDPVLDAIALILWLGMHGVLVMLYHNRKSVTS